ncbi:MAG: M23 family metallopeptidase [Treponema sp.]|nr:M23 family metallopeptidase [Treponema sp.]
MRDRRPSSTRRQFRPALRLLPLLLLFRLSGSFAAAQEEPGRETGPLRHVLIPGNPRSGDPVTLVIGAAWEGEDALLINGEGNTLTRTRFFDAAGVPGLENFRAAVLAVPSTARPGPAVISIEKKGKKTAEIPLVIGERSFASEEIVLNETLTGLRTVPDPRKAAESRHLWEILSAVGDQIYYTGTFLPPVASTRRTGFFGDRRVFKYSDGTSNTAIHAGVDYGVPAGTGVRACGSGKVVLARPRIVTGNSVVIEHLPGVYSLYYHLDRIDAVEGTLVQAGTLLGLSGATGLATGPHLHWELRVSGENTDPDAFLARPILDKDAVLAKMNESGL